MFRFDEILLWKIIQSRKARKGIYLLYLERKAELNERRRIEWNNFSERLFLLKFRFQKPDFPHLLDCVGLPDTIILKNGTRVTAEEILLIVLHRLAYPNRLEAMEDTFGLSKSNISLAFNFGINYIYSKFSHLLSFDSVSADDLEIFCQAILQKGCPLSSCCGFIDGTLRPTCRPSKNQKQFYSGHKRTHGIKFQAAIFPNGIICHLAGPFTGNRHDAGILRDSGIVELLENKLRGYGNRILSLYGDQAYPIMPCLLRPFDGARTTEIQRRFNKIMSLSRITVEWSFGKILRYFAYLDFKKNLKLQLQPVGKMYIVGTILTNCHTCLYGSQVSIYFQCQPPALERYLVPQ